MRIVTSQKGPSSEVKVRVVNSKKVSSEEKNIKTVGPQKLPRMIPTCLAMR